MRFILALAAWLIGCRSKAPKKAEAPPPGRPGTNIPLAYPIVALTTEPDNLTYFPTEEAFSTRRLDSQFWPSGATVLDSAGGVYMADKTWQMDKPKNWMLDMGRTPYRIAIALSRLKTVDLEGARQMVIGDIRGERSYWSGDSVRRDTAIAYIQRYKTVAELVEGCKEYYTWR